MARAAGTVGFLFLVTACFAAIVQWLNARFGAAGRILVLAFLMLQLTSAGGTYPVQTSPGFFNALHPFLPMSYVVEALRRLITGGGLGPVWHACVVLARVHRGRPRADRRVGPPPAGVDARPAAPGAEPVSLGDVGPAPVRIRAMESSSAAAGGSTRREATRQKLYEAAVTLIAEQGFSATTVDEIAERAGVAKGTVYYNFASKSVLFEELLRHGVGLLTASLREAAEKTARDGGEQGRRPGRDDPGRPRLHRPLPGLHPAVRGRAVAHQPGLAVHPDGGPAAGRRGRGGRAARRRRRTASSATRSTSR